MVNNAFLIEQIKSKQAENKLGDLEGFRATMNKHFEQYKSVDQIKLQGQAQATLASILELANQVQNISLILVGIKKEGLQGPDVALEVLSKSVDEVHQLAQVLSHTLEVCWREEEKARYLNFENTSIQVQLFGSFIPICLELMAESLKSCTPGMKKKKNQAFDDLKSQVIKPLKDLFTVISGHFAKVSDRFSQMPDYIQENVSLQGLSDNEQLVKYAKEKRIAMTNKEVRASYDKFKDLALKLSKRYAQFGGQLKGLNP
mmetsp:Transcript_8641/g.14629  ORF Transcript_8641/g.14629 Transcript_8641/m.14629 type:complete len:259 (+) Transcript_8641:2565-3341(+)